MKTIVCGCLYNGATNGGFFARGCDDKDKNNQKIFKNVLNGRVNDETQLVKEEISNFFFRERLHITMKLEGDIVAKFPSFH